MRVYVCVTVRYLACRPCLVVLGLGTAAARVMVLVQAGLELQRRHHYIIIELQRRHHYIIIERCTN